MKHACMQPRPRPSIEIVPLIDGFVPCQPDQRSIDAMLR